MRSGREAGFDILGHRVRVVGTRSCRDRLAALLRPFRVRQGSGAALSVRFAQVGGRFTLHLPGLCRWDHPALLVDFCEWWLISWGLAQRPDLCQLHGAAVAGPAGALLLPGASGAGKTTLTLALMASGLLPLADDIILLDDWLQVHPFQRCFHIDENTGSIARSLGLVAQLATAPALPAGYCRPLRFAAAAVPRLLVWPRYQPGAALQLERLRPAQSFTMLANSLISATGPSASQLERLRRLVDGTTAWQLVYADLDAARQHLVALLAGRAP